MISEIKTIYHYCSTDAFLKILLSNSIFLTHCRMLNDGKEDRMFLNSFLEFDLVDDYSDVEIEIARKIIDEYKKKVTFPYIACFSKKDDILSQWIAYGDDGRGVSIGFDLSKIPFIDLLNEQHGDNPKVIIDEVGYSDDNDELIRKIFGASSIIYKKEGNAEKAIACGLRGLERLSIFTKSTSFSHEDEVRMVYYPCYRHLLRKFNQEEFEGDVNYELDFLSSATRIKSYFKYRLPLDTISSITLGPKNQIDFTQLMILLSQTAPRVRIENNIKYSKISYNDF